jgi:hypothetical protein
MEPTSRTIEILQSIRDEVRRLDLANSRLDQMNGRIDHLEDTLGRRIVESGVRTATAITELAGSVQMSTELLRSQHDLRPRVEKCEREIDALKQRLPDA